MSERRVCTLVLLAVGCTVCTQGIAKGGELAFLPHDTRNDGMMNDFCLRDCNGKWQLDILASVSALLRYPSRFQYIYVENYINDYIVLLTAQISLVWSSPLFSPCV
jgi:hypothetical protein